MAYKRKKNRLPPFVPLLCRMLNHKAYIDLSASAAKALPYFLWKVKNSDYRDERRYLEPFEFSYTEAESYGFSRKTFARVIRELVRKGFIDPYERGGLKSGGFGYNKFRLSLRWEDYGKQNFERKEWYQFPPHLKER